MDFFEKFTLNISSGVIGGCIVAFFETEAEKSNIFFILGVAIIFSAISFGINRVAKSKQSKINTDK